MSQDETAPARGKRERSTRHPSVPLAESVELCRFIEGHGLDGMTAADIATSLGYKNIKTNTFSARLSAARQFGLLILKDEGYSLTPLSRSILHPVDPADIQRLYRQALLQPPIYADLANQFADKKLPDANILGNFLYHNHQIIPTAKQAAAEAFLESAKFAGAIGDDNVYRANGQPGPATPEVPAAPPARSNGQPAPALVLHEPTTPRPPRSDDMRIDLRLWGTDAGKAIRVRAPEVITPASFERLIQTLRLHLRIEEPEAEDGDED
jgi:hypothetical protein